ncbi:MAG: peptide chain release factor 3 [Vallitaleaceae bacterium]|jgi:peptide chain release factor 3|nr:peptide chain release factor 3 [Vallitaleaceae bacterium]
MSNTQYTFSEEIKRRRTFAIISHPDAGKTTLTEKFLLYGGAIREAGTVKSRRSNKHAVSDWMEIEKQRGISVASSVLQFNYDDFCINILDTPGHQDFSEDTYRTLIASDSAVMVIDSNKGVEAQTKKLFHVCKMRSIPIFTFINKMDRQGMDPFDLIDDLEEALGIHSYPIDWPIGNGKDFRGVYNRLEKRVELFNEGNHGQSMAKIITGDAKEEKFKGLLGDTLHQKLLDDIELLDVAGDEFDLHKILTGELTPVFFGSALTNFGVEPFLKAFLQMTPSPLPRKSNKGYIDPEENNLNGFIFKIQANMNPAHRDRIAFLRICSGEYKKGMMINHVNTGKKIKLSQPQQFMAQDRVIVESAYAGDIIGLHDTGIYNIGDTLSENSTELLFDNIPSFSPEHFIKISTVNAMKRKQFLKGIGQLTEEGSIQIFRKPFAGSEELIVGVVGLLQLEVLKYRLTNEYGVEIRTQEQPYRYIRWVNSDFDIDRLSVMMNSAIAMDKDNQHVILFEYEWSISRLEERTDGLVLRETSFDYS